MLSLRGVIASMVVVVILASSVACSPTPAPPAAEPAATSTLARSASETAGSQSPTQWAATRTGAGGAGSAGTETDGSPIPTEEPTGGSSDVRATSAEVDPAGPDITLYTLPECSVVPNGALSGADALTLLVAVRNSGPGSWNGQVAFRVTSDAGVSSQGNAALSSGSGFTAMQVDLSDSDYRRNHRFTITADPDNQIRERDETNNQLVISVSLPSRPTGTVNVNCTSP
jgi:CARDB